MTKELLEDYPYICRRIARMESICADTVEGSSTEFPYTKHTICVQGVAEPGASREAHLAELHAKRLEIEQWVAGLPTEKEKSLVELHALRGLGWKVVFGKAGYRSPDSARMAYKKILERHL